MSTTYAMTCELDLPLAQALHTLRDALTAEQITVVTEVDVQAKLLAKLGVQSHPQRLLGICAPGVVHALLSAESDIGALLPCGCGVSEAVPGRTRIALQDPRLIAAASGNPKVRAVCEKASASVRRVIDRLAASASCVPTLHEPRHDPAAGASGQAPGHLPTPAKPCQS